MTNGIGMYGLVAVLDTGVEKMYIQFFVQMR